MKPGWYILCYHNVSWEDGPYTRGIQGTTCPPDVFAEHVECVRSLGELVSIPEGIRRLEAGGDRHPLFSFWFDDGLAGVRRHALPTLSRYNCSAAMSVCSRFFRRVELFWRFQLSYLNHIDGARFLRSRLRKRGFAPGTSVSTFTFDHFSQSNLEALQRVYGEHTSLAVREDAFRLFETEDGLRELAAKDWVIANHSAAHYPVGEAQGVRFLEEQFGECEVALLAAFGKQSDFWVLPFDRPGRRCDALVEAFAACAGGRRLVLVGNRVNTRDSVAQKRLFRIGAPIVPGDHFVRGLKEQLAAASMYASA